MTTPAIELRGVSRRFRGTTVLDELRLEVMPGVVGLLGPNGAGKTTLLRILATVLGADGGSVRILGRDPADTTERTEIRRRLGYLPQELGYPRGFTAYRFVDYMAVLKQIEEPAARRAEVRRVLEDVDLADRAAKSIRTLSGGQRRRVGLAQALLGSPELLVLDEPTTGLDPEQRVALRQVLAERGRASTVLIATHQTEDVAALCEHVIVLDRGSVSFQGPCRARRRSAGKGLARRCRRPACAGLLAYRDRPLPQPWRRSPGRRAGRAHARGRLPPPARRDRARDRGGGGMSTARVALPLPLPAARSALGPLAWIEAKRFARHPLFLTGFVLALIFSGGAYGPVELDHGFVPSFFVGIFGLVVAARLTASTRRCEAVVDAAPVSETTRTAALCAACLVPAAAGLVVAVFFQVVMAFHDPRPDYVYGVFTTGERYVILLVLPATACLGGPLLGVAVGRWLRFPGAALLVAVALFLWSMLAGYMPSQQMDASTWPARILHMLTPYTAWIDNNSDSSVWVPTVVAVGSRGRRRGSRSGRSGLRGAGCVRRAAARRRGACARPCSGRARLPAPSP